MKGKIVIACYQPKEGQQAALKELVKRHLPVLREQDLVTERAPIIMQAKDGTILEVFEWKSAHAIEQAHTNPAVLALWEEFSEVCDYTPLAQLEEARAMFAEFDSFT